MPLRAAGVKLILAGRPLPAKRRDSQMLRAWPILFACLIAAACSQQPVVVEETRYFQGAMPVDFGGSWERDYARDDQVNAVLREAYNRLARSTPDQRYPGAPPPGLAAPSSKDTQSLFALARLAEEITRPDELTISQNEYEISVARKDDFSLQCAFYDGVATSIENPYGTEICGWDGQQLVSHLILPDGLQVTHRFTISADRQQLRIVTTVASSSSRVPFTIRRFYRKFNRPQSSFNCIETLSMKRVCSTGEIRR